MLAITQVSAVLCLLLAQTLSAAPAPPSRGPDRQADGAGECQFMLGGHFESEGKLDRAMAAYREAARLDPESAEIRAELAGFFARQGRVDDASREARAALALDPANHEANRILGSILASLADPGTVGNTNDSGPGEAALHLERGRRGDGTDADPALDLALARLYIRSRQHDKAITLLQDLLERELISEAYLLLPRPGRPRVTPPRRHGRWRQAHRRTPACCSRWPRCTKGSSDGPTRRPHMSARPHDAPVGRGENPVGRGLVEYARR